MMSSILDLLSRVFIKTLICGSVFFAAVFFYSCAGGPASGGTPEWLTSFPADTAYYVGIGGSNGGNLAEDREKAAAAARADLAAQISAQVSSELDISSSASSGGEFSESVKRTVSESVEQNLQSVETVDSWISPEQGAWVYVRLSKAVWAAIVNREISDLTLRANGILEPVARGNMTEAEDMAALGRAREALLSSPWGLRVKDASFKTGNFLLDVADSEISERIGSLNLAAEVVPSRVKYGSEVSVRGVLATGSGRDTGSYPLFIAVSGGEMVPFTTRADGGFTITVSPETLSTGTVRMEIAPEIGAWGIPSEGFPVTRTSVELVVDPILLAVSVNSSEAPDLEVLNGAVGDWISDLSLPAESVAPGQGDIDLTFDWKVNDFPRSDRLANAPYITQVGAVLTISRNGNVLMVREVDAFKDGGLDWEQAHQRSARGLLKGMAENPMLARELTEALGL